MRCAINASRIIRRRLNPSSAVVSIHRFDDQSTRRSMSWLQFTNPLHTRLPVRRDKSRLHFKGIKAWDEGSGTKDLLCSRVCLPTSKEKKAVVCNDILTDYKLQHHSSTSHEVQSAWYLDQRPFEVSPTVDRLNAGKCGLYEF